jgi:glycosyltransferase involved in cell wall biosynthesis
MKGAQVSDAINTAHNSKAGGQSKSRIREGKKSSRIYLMDLWSFIPYYIAHLCKSLRSQSVEVVLGSPRYHLDRDFFHKLALSPDPGLLDWGGRLSSAFLRRLVKSLEYVINLLLLCIRFWITRPAIIHVQFLPFLDRGFPFEIWFLRWCLRRGIRVVYTVHNLPERDARPHSKLLCQQAYTLANALVCHSEKAKDQLTQTFGIPSERVWMIPHGPLFEPKQQVSTTEGRSRLGLANDQTIVLYCGVINNYKGIPFLLDSWNLLISAGTKARLVIAGTGAADLLADIRQKVSSLGLTGCVDLWLRFIPVDQLPLLHVAADILVYPYQAATTSGALLTGMNYGKAIVATKLPFFLEHLNDGEDAILVDYGDVEGLARSLRVLINDKRKRNRLAHRVRERSEAHASWDQIALATKSCYDRILEVSHKGMNWSGT